MPLHIATPTCFQCLIYLVFLPGLRQFDPLPAWTTPFQSGLFSFLPTSKTFPHQLPPPPRQVPTTIISPCLPPVCPLPTNLQIHLRFPPRYSFPSYHLFSSFCDSLSSKGCSTLNTTASYHQERSEKASLKKQHRSWRSTRSKRPACGKDRQPRPCYEWRKGCLPCYSWCPMAEALLGQHLL